MRQSAKESKVTKRKLRSSYFTSIISITLVLFLLGLLGLLMLNSKKISDYVKENIGFSVILKENIKEADINRLQKNLDASKFVKSTKFISKAAAAKELSNELGEDFIEFLGYNPLLASIEARLYADYANTDSIAVIEKYLQKYTQVKEVFYQKSLVHLINENIKKISLIIFSFSGLLFLIALTLINNTIRLSVYSKRFIINTMQLVGATNSFIRKPFLAKGVLTGSYSAILAISMLMAILYFIQKELEEILFIKDVKMIGALFASVLILGILFNWLSTFFAVNRYLKMKSGDLYY